jgi:hypothetical protein
MEASVDDKSKIKSTCPTIYSSFYVGTLINTQQPVLRIQIRIIWPDPDSEFCMPDPDPRLQNWHQINLFSEEKYCE